MSAFRTIVGAALGATVADVALRVRTVAKERDASIMDVLPEMPEVLAEDARVVAAAAKGAIDDGRKAAGRKEREIDLYIEGLRTVKQPGGEA